MEYKKIRRFFSVYDDISLESMTCDQREGWRKDCARYDKEQEAIKSDGWSKVKCPKCNGEGGIRCSCCHHESTCEFCGGKGEVWGR